MRFAQKLEDQQILEKTSLYELIRAASNNFRHHEECHGMNSKNNTSIFTLRAAGLRRPWNRNMCAEVIELIGWESQIDLLKDMKTLGSEVFQYQTDLPLQ